MARRYSDGVKDFILVFFISCFLGAAWLIRGIIDPSPASVVEIEFNEQELMRILNNMRLGHEIIVKRKASQSWVIQMKRNTMPEDEKNPR